MIHGAPPESDRRHVDPILAAIERHRLAHYDFGEAVMASDEVAIQQRGGDTSPGTLAVLDAKRDAAAAVDDQAWRDIFTIRPTTGGGLIALLRYLDIYQSSYEGMDDEPEVFSALAAMAQALLPAPDVAPGVTHVDPHVALLPALRQAYAWTRDAAPFMGEPERSPEGRAHAAVMRHCWSVAKQIGALPPPTTSAGLGALALALSVEAESCIGQPENDGHDHERYPEERRLAAAVQAMMTASNTQPLPEWLGFGGEPDMQAGWDALVERKGGGSLPAWALAGKAGPDAEEIAVGEEVTSAVAPAPASPAHPPVSDLARACIEHVERMAQWDRRSKSEPLTDEQLDADLDQWGAALQRAITEPSANLVDLAAKARLLRADLEQFKREEERTQANERLVLVILREVVTLAGKSSLRKEDTASEGATDTARAVEAPAASLPVLDLSGYSIPQLCALFDVYERAEDQFHIASWWPKLGTAGSELVTDEGDRCMALKGVVADELQKRTSADETNADDRAEKLMRRALVSGGWEDVARLACGLRNEVMACQGRR